MFPWKRKIYQKDPLTGQKHLMSVKWYFGWYEEKVMTDGSRKLLRQNVSADRIAKLKGYKKGPANRTEVYKLMEEYSHGESNKDINMYFSEFQKIVLQDLKITCRPGTYKIYEYVVKYFSELMNDKPLKMYTQEDIKKYKILRLNSFRKEPERKHPGIFREPKRLSPVTVNIELRHLKHIFQIAVESNPPYIKTNPCSKVPAQTTYKKERTRFTDEQIMLVMANIQNPILKDIVTFALHSGCRIDEICNLKYSNIDLKENCIRILNTEDFKTKTGEIRNIPISPELRELFLPSFGKVFPQITDISNTDGYLWGHKYSKNYISRAFKKVLRQLKFPEKYCFHCLRHTAISNWIKDGIPDSFVQTMAGHSSFETTLKYIHPDYEGITNKMRNYKQRQMNYSAISNNVGTFFFASASIFIFDFRKSL